MTHHHHDDPASGLYDRRYGSRYNSEATTKEIAATLRSDIRSAVKAGELPRDWKYSVRLQWSTHSRAIDIKAVSPRRIYAADPHHWDPENQWVLNDETGECTVYLGTELNANGSTISSIIHKGNNSSGVAKTYANFETYIVDGAAGSEDGRILFTAMVAGAIAPHLYLEGLNTIVGTKSVLATTATAGFLHVGRCAGAPTGVPDLYTGKCPMVVDSTNGRLYVYHSGGWHYATLT